MGFVGVPLKMRVITPMVNSPSKQGVAEGERKASLTAATRVDFETAWCAGGVVAHVTHAAGGRRPRMEFRLAAPTDSDMA
jgi:hypothetical protein